MHLHGSSSGSGHPHIPIMNAESQDNGTVAEKPTKKFVLSKTIVLSAAAAVVLVLALALGLGLGLGLKKNSNGLAHPPNPPPSSSEGWRRDPQDYILSPNWDTKAPNTTRYYTLNLTELPNGAPDGVSVRMLIINGKFPGPVIEANEGDQLVVQVNNFMTLPSAIHWHGQYQNGKTSKKWSYCRNWFHGRNVWHHAMRYST